MSTNLMLRQDAIEQVTRLRIMQGLTQKDADENLG